MNNYQLAFAIGLFGSIHCIGMCGPLAFAIPYTGNSRWLLVWDKFIYQLGRVTSYTLLGIITGIIGKQLWLAGAQQGVSLVSGVLIIMAACSRLFRVSLFKSSGALNVTALFTRFLSYALKQHAGHFFIGALNGFLPCGFVYLALAGAVNTSSAAASAQYMFWFGIGTLPLMLVASLGAGFFSATVRVRLNKVVPYFMLCLGIWFILRGLTLDIPYLSPAKTDAVSICK
ncbi:sulfite exporter TauE/SafE family protein [Mucilaginibacter hurinus]|uniref:Sulfite exporter TauE/SafE family protein n=1 Tax=Mucilaginibacter hurinus TaxID=2201324 RepID=A0A367GQU3_9SPHI|nr:sulfite exporter TauE/SafE family protein [Mucilaginibacter hurinus]RCH55445.1 sulfite exporter TauE/SafE family protein [Mucilaginibacter hurinus]